MKDRTRILNGINDDIKAQDNFDQKVVILVSDRYRERLIESEREEKVLLDMLTSALQGKELVVENNSRMNCL